MARGDTPADERLRTVRAQIADALASLPDAPDDARAVLERLLDGLPVAPLPAAPPPVGPPPATRPQGPPTSTTWTMAPVRARGLLSAVAAAGRELRSPTSGADRRTRLARAVRGLDGHPDTILAARSVRRRLPGDAAFGDPLSLAPDRGAGLLGSRLAALQHGEPSAAKELAFSALQVWEGLAGRRRVGLEEREVAILFTDLVGFSTWVLEVGDPAALETLRRIGARTEPEVTSRGGAVVKRLGDGVMAVFDDVAAAVDAALAMVAILDDTGDLQVRAGVHVGHPLQLGADWFGADVNVAARVGAAAGAGEVLVTGAVRSALPPGYRVRRRGALRAKGVPQGVTTWAVMAR